MRHTSTVMVVDDDQEMCAFLRTFLETRGYQATVFHRAEDAVRQFEQERPDAVILDVVIPGGMDGLTALPAFRRIDRDVPVIVLSGLGRTAIVVQAMKLGAFDFVSKPFVDSDLDGPVANALRQRRLSRDVAELREELQAHAKVPMLSGSSPRMIEVRELIERVADTDVTVLIRGESGTGKELVARSLYAASQRRTRAFVKVNCAALPAELLESELFGFERGAFTGAIHQKPGKFEFANQGTLFLDEVSEMSPALQAKLLQVLQDGEFSRLGGKTDVRVDVRVVAATNRDLEHAVSEGLFREDLFFRLNVVSIHLPPLRDRRDEIPALTTFFLKKYAVQYKKPLLELSPETMQLLMEHAWPGNVRELENLAKRGVVLGSEAAIRKELQHAVSHARVVGSGAAAAVRARSAPPAAAPAAQLSVAAAPPVAAVAAHGAMAPPNGAPLVESAVTGGRPDSTAPSQCSLKDIARHAARAAERELILRMLQHTRWNRKEAAEILGISYKALLYKIKENGLDKAS